MHKVKVSMLTRIQECVSGCALLMRIAPSGALLKAFAIRKWQADLSSGGGHVRTAHSVHAVQIWQARRNR